MARPRTYDPEEVLDRSVLAFWECGYHDTSVQDLVEATGVQRYGLYETWGDKRGLFLAALERYNDAWISIVLGGLEEPEASLPAIRRTFDILSGAEDTGHTAPRGCLMCNSAAEIGGEDPDADAILERYMDRLHSAFEGALRRARELEEIPASIDPVAHARFLGGIVLGVSVHKKTPAGQAALRTFVDCALQTLNRSE